MSHSALHIFSVLNHERVLAKLGGVVIGLAVSGAGVAAGQVNSISTSETPATPFSYTLSGVEYQWGMGSNQMMEGFSTTEGQVFAYAMSADRVDVLRDDIEGITTGEPCGIFVERLSDTDTSRVFAADYPNDAAGTGNCDLSELLASRVINRGAIDLFSNRLPDAKNIERLDYVYEYGVLTPFQESDLALAGHAAAEKSSNNPVQVAAILELDVLGQPAAFGPLVLVGEHNCYENPICYGITDLQHSYSFLQNDFNEPQSFPMETERSFESVGMAFISVSDLGLSAGQRYYGVSFFGDDVNATQHDLLDPSTYPDDTADANITAGDDADIYGGLAGYFLENAVTVATGSVFNDVNGDGIPDSTEAGISDISITLYYDVDGNGLLDEGIDTPVGDSIDSDVSGNFVLPGLPNGNFLVVLDSNDPELPPGLVSAPGTNPYPLSVAGIDTNVYFPFVNPNGSDSLGDGGADSGSTDGAADSGTADSGSSDGAADSGTADSGSTDGAADSGTADSGSTDGAADSGTADSGSTDGAADSGTADSGSTDGAADSGTADSGSTDGAADSGTADSGSTDGAADSGTADSGSSDGAADSGTADSGATDGAADSGTADSGSTDGAADSGTADSGATDGAADSGSADSGTADGTGSGEGGAGSGDGSEPIDDGTTSALDDSFEINQGSSATFDVLANDTDAAGGGLTLLSVSESANATITIVNNEISYRPNFGFYGTDTFLYVMTDANGTEVTGNVSVSVVRFSDLNGNMVNDFVECDCTNLVLQTGIHGAGIGKFSQFALLVLSAAVWVRRRTNRNQVTRTVQGEELR